MKRGVLLMAYGSPDNLGEVEDYFTHIRGGKKPSKDELENLVNKYKAIGGGSPLKRITEEQRIALESRIRDAGYKTEVYAAMKHSHPFIEEKISEAYSNGVRKILCIVLAPHYSRMSVGSYMERVGKKAKELGIEPEYVYSWGTNKYLIEAWSRRIREKFRLGSERLHVVFTAHSLPERLITEGDPYRDQLIETSSLIAKNCSLENWSFSFQSAGHTSEKWMGPDILDHLEELYNIGKREFLIAPIGFVSDHLEILYDIDVECAEWAKKKNVLLLRCISLNSDPLLIECLFSIVKERGFLE
jgi:ferrochelatase